MQAHTLFELSAYSTYDSSAPVDLLFASHLMLDATVRLDSGVTPCEDYPTWTAFTGQITQNVAQATHVLSFFTDIIL
jgi:hypothetical protein